MAAATGERAPAFSSEELEKLVDGVLPQYTLLYGPPDQQVSAHQKIDIWRAIAKDVRALGVHNRRGTHCRKRWEDIRRGSRKTAEALLGMASQPRRGASRTLTPLMSRILAVAYPDLDGCLRTSQQTQGASSGGGEVASAQEGAASHMAPEGHATDSDITSETEGEGGSTTGTRGDVSDTDTSSEGSSLAVAATSVHTDPTGTAATQRTSSALPAAPRPFARARKARKPAISFAPGTSGPAPVTPAALSEEVIDLLRTIIVGQSTLLNAIQGVEREVHQSMHTWRAFIRVQYSSLSSAARFVILEEEQEGNGWEDVEFGFHAVPIPRGVCREELHGRRIKIQVYPGRRIFTSKKRLSPKVKISTEDSSIAYPEKGTRRSDWTGRFVPLKKIFGKKTKGVILTPVGGGSRRPGWNRQNTGARSKDRRGYSGFPAGLAGDRQKAAHQPSGKHPSMRMPAPNGAGGVEGVRRVQLHPSRFSVSAWQTLKILVGPCYGGPCSAHAIGMGTAGAPRDPTTPHTAILFLAAKNAAMEDSPGQRKTGGTPPFFCF
ncbi:hypothetical protein NDU88_006174 [Pleurodeles waltl]|uniref:Myb/SANT-like DNA-binding domain-containing protein n=1 Tax=Pleurodeles waltl TaxID=8319 RepID=A0AAV7TWG1_PLEWA|nr:hypothetical protein NDU88_006174 [Pleurodeles waltl]